MNTESQPLQVVNHGQIESLLLPQGWVEREIEPPELVLWSMREFHPADIPAVRLCLYYRGTPVLPASGDSFQQILQKTPHELEESEWWSIQEILRDAALPGEFVCWSARTDTWNGRRVLILEGNWPNAQEDSFGIFLPVGEEGNHVQEIHYVAPTTYYFDCLTTALQALHQVEWKVDSRRSSGATAQSAELAQNTRKQPSGKIYRAYGLGAIIDSHRKRLTGDRAIGMQFRNYTTEQLKEFKMDFEYSALMSALEQIAPDEEAMTEYFELSEELARREKIAQESISRERFSAAIEQCLLLISMRSLNTVIPEFARGVAPTGKFREVRLTPRNSFFREIIVQIDEKRRDEEIVRFATFVPSDSVPIEWVKTRFADLSSCFESETGERHYDLWHVADEERGRIEFSSEIRENGDERVTKIVVWCLALVDTKVSEHLAQTSLSQTAATIAKSGIPGGADFSPKAPEPAPRETVVPQSNAAPVADFSPKAPEPAPGEAAVPQSEAAPVADSSPKAPEPAVPRSDAAEVTDSLKRALGLDTPTERLVPDPKVRVPDALEKTIAPKDAQARRASEEMVMKASRDTILPAGISEVVLDGYLVSIPGNELKVGRRYPLNENGALLADPHVSRDHGTLRWSAADRSFYFKDHSSHGTWIKREGAARFERVKDEEVKIGPHDEVRLGSIKGPQLRVGS